MSEENKCYAYFTVAGDFDPDAVTKRVGLQPINAWTKGDLNPRNGLERKFSRWSLRSRLADLEPLESHVTDVLDQLDASPQAVKEVSADGGGVLQLVGYFHSLYPGVHLDREAIRRLADYALSVDCDFYYLYSDAREDTE